MTDAETARGFLHDLAKRRGHAMDAAVAERIIERLGWLSPYYLERIAEDACARAAAGAPIGLDLADAAMDGLLELDKRLYWATWREHLDRNFPDPDRTRLYRILETIATAGPNGADGSLLLAASGRGDQPITELALRDLLDTLVADGYLVRGSDGRWRFLMQLLREWWLRYVVL